jgi:hypothetical protein
MISRRMVRSTLVLAALALLPACGPATYNVRASRAFSNEAPDLAVARDRADELDRALELGDRLLTATPYAARDRWVDGLRLEDERADAIRARFRDRPPYSGDYEVPLAKLYRVALDEALERARVDRTIRPAEIESLFAAAAGLAEGAAALTDQWAERTRARRDAIRARQEVDWLVYQSFGRPDPPELTAARARLASAERELEAARGAFARSIAAIAAARAPAGGASPATKAALDAVSFVLRMHIEALAVAPYVVKQAKRLARDDASLGELVTRAQAAGELLDEEREALEALAEALTAPAGLALEDTAGFAMHESLFEQAARVNFDATHAHIKGDAELLFFHQLATDTTGGASSERLGRTRRLAYSVDPVFLVGGRVIAAYDFLNVRNAASLNAGFTTDRLFSSGGDIETNNSLGQLLGLDGLASDFFDIGVGLLGVRTSVRVARFTAGEVTEIAVDPVTGKDAGVTGRAPLQLDYQQIDVGYDLVTLAPDTAEDLYVEELLVGYRYMSYGLPRILYELEEARPGQGTGYVLDRQSPAQEVESRLHMGGFAVRFGQGDWPRVSVFGDLGVYGGAGPISYYLTPDPTAPGGAREVREATMLALDARGALGARLRLTPARSRPRLVAELSYRGELVGQGIVSTIYEARVGDTTTYTIGRTTNLGGFDLFHGPRLMLVAVF